MFKDQKCYNVGDIGFIENEYFYNTLKVVIINVNERKNLFGKKRYFYVVEIIDGYVKNDYITIMHKDFIPMNKFIEEMYYETNM